MNETIQFLQTGDPVWLIILGAAMSLFAAMAFEPLIGDAMFDQEREIERRVLDGRNDEK